MPQLTFYTNPQSRGRIAHWMLEELGEPYETVWLGRHGEVTQLADSRGQKRHGRVW